MTSAELQEVKSAVPIKCQVRCPDGKTYPATISGRKLKFPNVWLDNGMIYGEISWSLAYRVLKGEANFIFAL